MCASRTCQSGRKCCLAGRVGEMAAPTVMLRRSVGVVSQEEEEEEEEEVDSDSD